MFISIRGRWYVGQNHPILSKASSHSFNHLHPLNTVAALLFKQIANKRNPDWINRKSLQRPAYIGAHEHPNTRTKHSDLICGQSKSTCITV